MLFLHLHTKLFNVNISTYILSFKRFSYNFSTVFFSLGRHRHWRLASPWLHSINPRDSLMPKDGDDGFFPTTGNELVSIFHQLSFLVLHNNV